MLLLSSFYRWKNWGKVKRLGQVQQLVCSLLQIGLFDSIMGSNQHITLCTKRGSISRSIHQAQLHSVLQVPVPAVHFHYIKKKCAEI